MQALLSFVNDRQTTDAAAVTGACLTRNSKAASQGLRRLYEPGLISLSAPHVIDGDPMGFSDFGHKTVKPPKQRSAPGEAVTDLDVPVAVCRVEHPIRMNAVAAGNDRRRRLTEDAGYLQHHLVERVDVGCFRSTARRSFKRCAARSSSTTWRTTPSSRNFLTMTSISVAAETTIIAGYDFSPYSTIVDVGGGQGRLLAAILAATPAAQGVLYDLPQAIAGAPALLRQQGVEDRVRLEAGSFFDSVPAGGDAYIMKLIIHDWPDEQAVAILRNVHAAAGGDATVLLIEMVLPDHDRDFPRQLGGSGDAAPRKQPRSRIPQPAGTSRIADDSRGANRLALQCRRGETRVRPLTRRWLWLSVPGGQAAAVFGVTV